MAPRVSNSRLSIPLPRSRDRSQGMHQPSADRLQTQIGQLPMGNRNPYDLNSNPVQWSHNCTTSQSQSPPQCPTINDLLHSVTRSDLPVSGSRAPFSKRQRELHARIQRLRNPSSNRTKKKRLFMVSALQPQSRDLDNIMTTPYSSTNKKL